MAVHYDPRLRLKEARQQYFTANRFGDDGGYALRWVPVKALGLSFKIPNSDARRRAVRAHDLHHVLTGYATDFLGEAEIGAWELASGCARHPAALLLNLLAINLGIFYGPRRLIRAFARGRRTANLYRVPFDEALLGRNLGQVRGELGLDAPEPSPRSSDVIGFAFTWLSSVVVAWALLALLLAPLVGAVLAIRHFLL